MTENIKQLKTPKKQYTYKMLTLIIVKHVHVNDVPKQMTINARSISNNLMPGNNVQPLALLKN